MKVNPKLLARMPRAVQAWQATGVTPIRGLRAVDGGTELLIYDVIGDAWDGITAVDVARFLADAPPGPITVRINSPGGYTDDGMAIYNMLAQRSGVTTVVDGVAASAASMVLMAGSVRKASAASLVMIHRSWGVAVGNEEDFAAYREVMLKTDGILAATYAAASAMPLDDVLAAMRAETYYTGEEALAAGLVSELMPLATPSAALPAAASAASLARRHALLRLADRA